MSVLYIRIKSLNQAQIFLEERKQERRVSSLPTQAIFKLMCLFEWLDSMEMGATEIKRPNSAGNGIGTEKEKTEKRREKERRRAEMDRKQKQETESR